MIPCHPETKVGCAWVCVQGVKCGCHDYRSHSLAVPRQMCEAMALCAHLLAERLRSAAFPELDSISRVLSNPPESSSAKVRPLSSF